MQDLCYPGCKGWWILTDGSRELCNSLDSILFPAPGVECLGQLFLTLTKHQWFLPSVVAKNSSVFLIWAHIRVSNDFRVSKCQMQETSVHFLWKFVVYMLPLSSIWANHMSSFFCPTFPHSMSILNHISQSVSFSICLLCKSYHLVDFALLGWDRPQCITHSDIFDTRNPATCVIGHSRHTVQFMKWTTSRISSRSGDPQCKSNSPQAAYLVVFGKPQSFNSNHPSVIWE